MNKNLADKFLTDILWSVTQHAYKLVTETHTVHHQRYAWIKKQEPNREHIKGFLAEYYISTMIYSWDKPFWSETLNMRF